VQKLIPDFKGVEVKFGKKNCPMLDGRTNHNAEKAERAMA
jgi:hypothetical protein